MVGASGADPQTSVEVQPRPHSPLSSSSGPSSGSSGMQEYPTEGVPVLDGRGNMVDYHDDSLEQRLPTIPEGSPSEERSSTHDERHDNNDDIQDNGEERHEDHDVIMNLESS